MLRAIQFNDQSGRSTVKVHDESADNPRLPSPSSLRSATSPKGRGKGCSHGTPKGV